MLFLLSSICPPISVSTIHLHDIIQLKLRSKKLTSHLWFEFFGFISIYIFGKFFSQILVCQTDVSPARDPDIEDSSIVWLIQKKVRMIICVIFWTRFIVSSVSHLFMINNRSLNVWGWTPPCRLLGFRCLLLDVLENLCHKFIF